MNTFENDVRLFVHWHFASRCCAPGIQEVASEFGINISVTVCDKGHC